MPDAGINGAVFAGGGEMGAIMRNLDWSRTALGPVETWSPALRMMVRFLLANRFPLLLWWGPQFCQLYNDAYRPILGAKHPQYVGRPVSECWSEIWHILEPLIRTPFQGGPSTWMEDILLEINRYGSFEETHFTIAYSPVPDETVPGGIGGVLATVHEISEKVVGDRRTRLLRDLGAGSAEETAEEVCARAAKILSGYPKDIPFALLYLADPGGNIAHLCASSGVNLEESDRLQDIACDANIGPATWPLFEVTQTENPQLVENLGARFRLVPPGPWTDPPTAALILPLKSNVAHQLTGFMVAGISSRLKLDDSYRVFLELVASQIATALARARAYEEERKRAEALAEIDRAKTVFFTNISHELRTPITLLLSPLEEMLRKPNAGLPAHERAQLAMAHRNGMRLLKLVNTLLDFSRIEAGRIQARYQPTDLAQFTLDLASMFQSATEKAALYLRVDCPPLPGPVYIDRDMWEKILLNLLSNAFKFTFQGGIEVRLRDAGACVELTIKDTGTGIPKSELPRLFERFHRVEGARGRTFEGSGIGLALVQELVKLHGGGISVSSVFGRGSTFTVSIPKGMKHLPQERVQPASSLGSATFRAEAWLAEALQWLPGPLAETSESLLAPQVSSDIPEHAGESHPPGVDGANILLADDNADMREYIRRLLQQQYRVTAVTNGEEALRSIKENGTDLVLTDVMMPVLDGFGLLRAIRSDPSTSTIPVIMLSARAGEESRVEGLRAGADDYLIKPFTARELLARVGSHLTISSLRKQLLERERELRQKAEAVQAALQESEERFRTIVTATSDAVYRMGPDWTEMRQLQGKDFITDTAGPTRAWLDQYIHPDDQLRVLAVIDEAIRNKSVFQVEHRVRRVDGSFGWTFSRAIPILDQHQEVREWLGVASDVTERKQMEEALRKSEKIAAVGRLAASVAHEINNPLEAVTNIIWLLQNDASLTQSAREYLKTADEELSRVTHLAQQTLGFYRGSTAIQHLQVGEIIESVLNIFGPKLRNKAIHVHQELNASCEISAIRMELRQAIMNLLSNSIDAVAVGGSIRIRTSSSTMKGQKGVRITIADNGHGIPQSHRAMVFEPFFSTKPHIGTGLGLWIAQQTVLKHQGSVRLKSNATPGQSWTVFSIFLPECGLEIKEDPSRSAQQAAIAS